MHTFSSGMDPLRDDGLLYERLLRTECNVRTKLVLYPGLPHAFWSMFPDFKKSSLGADNTAAGFEWLLEQGSR